MNHRGAGILYTDGKKVLILYRSTKAKNYPNTWAPTGGGIENGENFLETAKRESLEEIGAYKGSKIAQFNDVFVMFVFKVDKPFNVRLNAEHTKAEWVDIDKVENYKLHPNFRKEWSKYRKAIEKNKYSFKEWLKFLN